MMQVTSGIMAYDAYQCTGTNAKGFISNSGTTLTLGNTYSRVTSTDYFLYATSSNTIVGSTGVYTLTGSNTISTYTPASGLPPNDMINYLRGYNIPLFSNGIALLPRVIGTVASIVYANNGGVSGFQTFAPGYQLGSNAAVLDSSTGIIVGAINTSGALLQANIVKLYWT
jgi:hypothetical protein